MSYRFNMYFAQLKDESEIIDMITRLSDTLYEKRELIIERNKFHIPSLQRDKSDVYADGYWLYLVFQAKMIYWPEHKLLGVAVSPYGFMRDIFPRSIEFQDSCEQDYGPEEWGYEINFFNEVRDKVLNMAYEEIIEETKNDWDDDISASDMGMKQIKRLEHKRRTLLYKKIYEGLNLEEWLYGHGSESFKRFAVSPIDSEERAYGCEKTLDKLKAHMKGD